MLLVLFSICTVCDCAHGAPIKKAPIKKAAPEAAPNFVALYVSRVRIADRDTMHELGKLLVSWQQFDDLHKSKRKREDDESREKQIGALRLQIRNQIPIARRNAARWRAISPIPASLKKADDRFIEASLETESALDFLLLYLASGAVEWKSQANKALRKSLADRDAALMILAQRTDGAIAKKVYVP